jgi:selenide,water dikinase
VQTVDFFTPIVDDPYDFGRIAAANALSDVYAMGGRPLTALNIVCFPQNVLDVSVLQQVLRGGLAKLHEADVALVGGHSIEDQEMKYGLAITGTIHPDKVVHNHTARPGDRLILTKPLGTGIISTAIKGNMVDRATVKLVTESMVALNRTAAELMLKAGVSAATDITGFGLLGHAAEMVAGTDAGFIIEADAVPVFEAARELAEMGMMPGGLHRNREFRKDMVDMDSRLPQTLQDILYDPQTSGGMLIAVAGNKAEDLLNKLRRKGVEAAAIIGEVVAEPRGRIIVR